MLFFGDTLDNKGGGKDDVVEVVAILCFFLSCAVGLGFVGIYGCGSNLWG